MRFAYSKLQSGSQSDQIHTNAICHHLKHFASQNFKLGEISLLTFKYHSSFMLTEYICIYHSKTWDKCRKNKNVNNNNKKKLKLYRYVIMQTLYSKLKTASYWIRKLDIICDLVQIGYIQAY